MKAKLVALGVQTAWMLFHLALFIMAIKHRHSMEGIVWALLWVGEQIHLPPPSVSTLFRREP